MSEKAAKNFVKINENAVITANLSCRAIVQRFFLDHTGHSFTVTILQLEIERLYNTRLNRKTIRRAIDEIKALDIGLHSEVRKAGRNLLPIRFYTLKK
jgi:hypothetical protein